MAELPVAVQRARIRLMLEQPYLASAIARLPLVDASDLDWCATMATDGYYIYVQPAFAATLNDDELQFVLAHEVLHCVLGHLDRRGERHAWRWNLAVDYATNLLLVEFGLTMPAIGLLDRRYAGLTAEDIYDQLTMLVSAGLPLPLPGGADGGDTQPGFDLHLDPDDPRGESLRASEFPTTMERARMRQQLASELARTLQGSARGAGVAEIRASTQSSVPWNVLLAQFMSGLRRSDYRLFPPNRRHVWRGYYLPALGTPGPEHLVVAIDTSGSMSDALLARVLGEIDRLRAFSECRLTVLQADTEIQQMEEYEAFEPAGWERRPYDMLGRGGTSFKPVFGWLEQEFVRQGRRFDALIYLTDGCGTFPERDPGWPVVWVAPRTGQERFPFGRVIRLD